MKETNWIKIDEKPLEPGISVSRAAITESKDIPGEIRMFRGTTTMAFGMDEIAKAVSDPAALMKWVERMAEDILIEGNPDEGRWLSYEAYDLVWPVSNRDYVFQQTLVKSVHQEKNRTTVKVSSIEHPDYPEKSDRVRGILPTCVFTLDEVSENETHLEVMVQVDPGGSIPGFIKNMIQKGWSLKTMRALNNFMKND
ncbi:START domain-containing protein [Flavobacteriales bacterium]|nr:START domain-containing protein [Flavobacteriales bacterium]